MTMMKREGDPDPPSSHPRGREGVQALLNSDTAPVHESRQIHHPQDPSLTSQPRPFSSEHLPPTAFASHPRPPPPPSTHQPTYNSAPQPHYSPRPPSDPRGYPVQSPPQSHSGHGTPVGPPPGPYPPPDVKPPPPHHPPPPSQHAYGSHPPPPDYHRRALAPIHPPPADRPPPTTMDHGAPHHWNGAPEHHHVNHHPNGNGHPHHYMDNHQGYGAPHVVQPQSYAPSPVSGHHGYASYSQSSARKKQVRAQQACNQCRTRKQKCDEDRPCTYCRDNSLVCEYKDVPPPKTDRTMQQILDKLTAIESSVNRRMDKLESHLHLKTEVNGTSVSPTATHQTGGRSRSRDVSMVSADEQAVPASPATRNGPAANEESNKQYNDFMVTRLDDHKTAAHHLLRDWQAIAKYFNGVVNIEENYPMTLEEKRGSLRLYGRGEGLSYNDRIQQQQVGSPAQSETDSSDMSPSDTPSSSVSDDNITNNTNAIGELQCHSFKKGHVDKLVKGYIDNMHPFHPFLDKGRLLKQVEDFLKKMDPDSFVNGGTHASPSAIPQHLQTVTDRPAKKRRTDSDHSGRGDSSYSLSQTHDATPRSDPFRLWEKPESTITNAIILLVLALGAICLENDSVNGPIKPHVKAEHQPYIGRGRSIGIPSPAEEGTLSPYTSPSGPMDQSLSSIGGDAKKREELKNTDVIPGLKFYAQASDILGNMHSGNEVYHAQAFLLASLYINQLGRVLESYSWINSAARVIKINVKSNKDYLGHFEHGQSPLAVKGNETAQKRHIAKLDLIKATFWSAVQLESDILAEMSLPPSHITDYEAVVAYPSGVHDDLVMWTYSPEDNYKMFYTAQIWLRKTLNTVHTHVYGADRKAPQFQIGVFKPAYTETNVILVHLDGLYQWRKQNLDHNRSLGMAWDDQDPPAQELNTVRLRAKFYGAEYVMTRPYLHYAVHCPEVDRDMLRQAWRYIRALDQVQDIDKIDYLTSANNLPNTPQCDRNGINPDAIITMLLCRVCLRAAFRSTTAFDGMKTRLKVTNIFGTLHAQFGNCLVMAAVCESWLQDLEGLIDRGRVPELIRSTMAKCDKSKHLSPALGYDYKILGKALASLEPPNASHRQMSTPGAMEAPASRRQSAYINSAHSSFG